MLLGIEVAAMFFLAVLLLWEPIRRLLENKEGLYKDIKEFCLEFPLGRIYFGLTETRGENETLREKLHQLLSANSGDSKGEKKLWL